MAGDVTGATPPGSMRAEIAEQPRIIEQLLARRAELEAAAVTVRRRRPRFVLYAARGSSDNAATYGLYLAALLAGLPAGLAAPSTVTHYHAALDLRDALVVGISQSGETPDVNEYLEDAAARGATTVAVTNNDRSPIARIADVVLFTGAGEERAIPATKTYTAQLTALALFWSAWADASAERMPLERLPDSIVAVLQREEDVRAVAGDLAGAPMLLTTGRGVNVPTAQEAALKVDEAANLPSLAYSAADLLHGPVALVVPETPVLVFEADGPTRPMVRDLTAALTGRGARVVVIGPAPAADGGARHIEAGSGLPEVLSPIPGVVPAQLLAHDLATRRGLDPTRPAGLTKITRVR